MVVVRMAAPPSVILSLIFVLLPLGMLGFSARWMYVVTLPMRITLLPCMVLSRLIVLITFEDGFIEQHILVTFKDRNIFMLDEVIHHLARKWWWRWWCISRQTLAEIVHWCEGVLHWCKLEGHACGIP